MALLTVEEVQATNRLWGVRYKGANEPTNVFNYDQRKGSFHKYKNADELEIRVLNQDSFLGRLVLGLDYYIQNGNETPSQRSLMELLGVRSMGYLQEGLTVLEHLGAISVEKIPLTYQTAEGITVNPLRFRCKYEINVTYRRL